MGGRRSGKCRRCCAALLLGALTLGLPAAAYADPLPVPPAAPAPVPPVAEPALQSGKLPSSRSAVENLRPASGPLAALTLPSAPATGPVGRISPRTPADRLPGIGETPAAQIPAAPPDFELLRVGQRIAVLAKSIDEAGARAETARAAADRERTRLAELQGRQATLQARLDAMKVEIGQLASLQYRSGGVSPTADLILSGDAFGYLHMGAVYRRIADGQASLEKTYTERYHDLDGVVAEAAAAARALAVEEAAAARELTTLREASAEATRLLTGLDLAGLMAAPGHDPGPAARTALHYAVSQIGRPYVWGATGPDSFDCSGLTSRAWQSAGATVPRTSQEQWAQLPRIPLNEMRPGDLVVYFPDATHIGMYLGAGIMVHAPRPGRHVTTAKVDSLPILGVVRPAAPAAPAAPATPPPAASN
ncbi:C40 family peptidase [Yinghuangia soli]|uniref:C40 family peptidase n=1 Tax=Yinghuangia soli TaxID=2908204 RepID=A0AA41PX55_9ACTN|nr:C40 family peptidase [Yinghuangia soli]MCF2527373.1 C40 family peptidase [Yinghuangia soli]